VSGSFAWGVKTSAAGTYFATQQRDQTVKEIVEKERAATAAKSA